MNAYQEKFYQFILDRVKEADLEKAQALLQESFAKQADGSFDLAFLAHFESKISTLLKSEYQEEVIKIIQEFGKNFVR